MRASSILLAAILPLVLVSRALGADVVVNPDAARTPISPYVYGANQVEGSSAKFTAYRLGGNRLTGYNWENNFSHAGSDWQHSSDTYLCGALNLSAAECAQPGAVVTAFVDSARAVGAYPLVTLQMAGYVSADDAGTVSAAEVAPSARWRAVVAAKGSAFTTTPDPNDGSVYMDELVSFLVGVYGTAEHGGVRGYALDNEPDLWSSTHARIHPAPVGASELIDRSVALATAIKQVDASAEVFGFVSYGYQGFVNLQNAPDWSSVRGSYDWYTQYYLARMAAASQAVSTRLLDVLDLHFYSEAQQAGVRIQGGTTANAGARVQATRSLWDPSYGYSTTDPTVGENSWITQWNDPIEVIPRVRRQIAALYPDTKLALTEYDFGAADHVSGGIAQADALGIFGREGLYYATRWGEPGSYTDAAYRLYLDYDGNGAGFGDTSVSAATSDVVNLPAYAAVESGSAARLHLVLINRNLSAAQTVSVTIAGGTSYLAGHAWGFDSANASLTDRGDVAVTGNAFSQQLPAMSAFHVVLTPAAGTGGAGGTSGTGATGGTTTLGGRTNAGGAGRGGSPGSGGSTSGGVTATGGRGAQSLGGEPSTGGDAGAGRPGGRAAVMNGGASASSGSGAVNAGATGGPNSGTSDEAGDDSGCGCRVASRARTPFWTLGALAFLVARLRRGRRGGGARTPQTTSPALHRDRR
jgi:mannan endo-1,4-beta-mannosidase